MPEDVDSVTVYCKILRCKVDLQGTDTYLVQVIMMNLIVLLWDKWHEKEKGKLFFGGFRVHEW